MAGTVHEGHRGRMRKRFLATGFAGFPEHEMLEMLLYYCIPRRDTNEIARALIEKYGSLHAVLCADAAELQQFPDISENAAVYLTMFRAVYQYDVQNQMTGAVLDDFRKCCDFFAELYQYDTREIVRIALLDEKLRVIRCETVSEGHPSAAQITVHRITELAYSAGSNTVILAHNHPRGTASISPEDIAVTRHLVPILRQCAVSLADHIVVGENEAVSMREYGVYLGLEMD